MKKNSKKLKIFQRIKNGLSKYKASIIATLFLCGILLYTLSWGISKYQRIYFEKQYETAYLKSVQYALGHTLAERTVADVKFVNENPIKDQRKSNNLPVTDADVANNARLAEAVLNEDDKQLSIRYYTDVSSAVNLIKKYPTTNGNVLYIEPGGPQWYLLRQDYIQIEGSAVHAYTTKNQPITLPAIDLPCLPNIKSPFICNIPAQSRFQKIFEAKFTDYDSGLTEIVTKNVWWFNLGASFCIGLGVVCLVFCYIPIPVKKESNIVDTPLTPQNLELAGLNSIEYIQPKIVSPPKPTITTSLPTNIAITISPIQNKATRASKALQNKIDRRENELLSDEQKQNLKSAKQFLADADGLFEKGNYKEALDAYQFGISLIS